MSKDKALWDQVKLLAPEKPQISDVALTAFYYLILDADGVPVDKAAEILSGVLRASQADTLKSLNELVDAKMLIEHDGRYVVAAGACAFVDDKLLTLARLAEQDLEILGAPHSQEAMSTLVETFRDEEEPIVVAMAITHPNVFDGLLQRAEKGRITYFLMPRLTGVAPEQHAHYVEVMAAWKKLLRERTSLREYVKVFTTKKPYPELYTSMLSTNLVRFDQYILASPTTRAGQILCAHSKSSLYRLVSERYEDAYYASLPLIEIWPFLYLKHALFVRPVVLTALFTVLTIFLLYVSQKSTPPNWIYYLLASVLIGVISNMVHQMVLSAKPRSLRLKDQLQYSQRPYAD